MPVAPGTRLGPYEVTSQLGAGGMGEVYRATDTKLKRQVAIKVLPASVAADVERLARFQREAEVLASLNHPNIAAIYGLEEADGIEALVMELVEGPTLADRTAQGALPVGEALPIAKQIAEALEAAHEQGIIHRDLKPANIKVREDGTVKVLDFGLAKALGPDSGQQAEGRGQAGPSMAPTITTPALMTSVGMILGTAAYMSPEQARGKPVDKRADIWAFGCVLYEMLTGQRAFPGDDVQDTFVAIMRDEPDWARLPATLSPALATYIRRCLHKDPKQRIHDIADVRLALEGAFDAATDSSPARLTPVSRRWLLPLVAGVALVVVAATAAAVRLASPAAPPAEVLRVPLIAPPNAPLQVSNRGIDLAVSADGSTIVYVGATPDGEQQLFVKRADAIEAVPLAGTEGAADPFFSPDGAWVAFTTEVGANLHRVPTGGGVPEVIGSTNRGAIQGGTWTASGQIVVGLSNRTLLRTSLAGSRELTPLTEPSSESPNHRWPAAIAGRNAVVFTSAGEGRAELAVVDLDSQRVTTLGIQGTRPRYVTSGHLLYATLDGSVHAVRFDPRTLTASGAAVRVATGVSMKGDGALFDVSSGGQRLAYVTGRSYRGSSLVWVTRSGEIVGAVVENQRNIQSPRLSPDGTRVAVRLSPGIHILDLERGSDLTLTDFVAFPTWNPDGRTVTFTGSPSGNIDPSSFDIFARPADLSAPAAVVLDEGTVLNGPSWSPDGRALVFTSRDERQRDLWMLSSEGRRTAITNTPYDEVGPVVSPDGQWLAYASNQSGQARVYATPFPGRGRVVPVSTGPGAEPVWSRDGKELFFREGNRMLVAAFEPGARVPFGRPRVLFEGRFQQASGPGIPNYDVSLDGTRFLMVTDASTADGVDAAPSVVLVENWLTELARLAPGD